MSSKKDRLKGAIQSELKGDGIMREFIKNVNEDKQTEPENPSAEKTEASQKPSGAKKEEKKNLRQKAPSSKSGSRLPVPRNNTPKEWWVSFLAFLFVVGLILSAYFISTFESSPGSYVRLSGGPLLEEKVYPHGDIPRFRLGTPIYIHYISDGPVNTNVISIHVFVLDSEQARTVITSSQYKIDRNWRKMETHFQKEFFEYPGLYEIVIENENNFELARQIFEITR